MKPWAALAALAVLVGCVTEAPPNVRQAEQALTALALAPGTRVADLGAGSGYFALRLADAVGPSGVVYAVEVDPAALARLRERAAREGRANVVAIEASTEDPRLPDASVDLALVVGTYARLRSRTSYFEHVKRALRPGGRVAIVEITEPELFVPPPTTADGIVNQLRAAGFSLAERRALLERRTLLVFTPSQ